MRAPRGSYQHTPARRREILAAALACFDEAGFVNTTLADIRRRSGASNGSLYHHFANKERLAAEVYLQCIADYQAGLVAALAARPGAREGIAAVVAYHLHWVAEHKVEARFLAAARHAEFAALVEPRLAKSNAVFVNAVGGFFRRHIKAGALRPLAPEVCVALLLGPVYEVARHWMRDGHGLALPKTITELSDGAWRSLRKEAI
jgi:AcrR family transcriptional regulator